MKKTALIFRHLSPVHLGSYENTLIRNNFDLHYIDVYKDDFSNIEPSQHDVVIVLGGTNGANDNDKYPFLNDVMHFLEKRITRDKPTLGICLGSQIIAKTLGAKVFQGKQGFELGWSPLMLTEEGKSSAIKHFDPKLTSMFHSHGDTFDLPENATLLASSQKYPHQAYQYGKNILATQCHPEVTKDMIAEWLIMHVSKFSDENVDADINVIREETRQNISSLQAQSVKFLEDWLKDTKML